MGQDTAKPSPPDLLTPSEAGAELGLTAAAVKTHDAELRPLLTATGRRLYLRRSVEAFQAWRDHSNRRTSRQGNRQ